MRFGLPHAADPANNVESESDGLTEAVATSSVRHSYENDKPFSAYATEYANVVRNLLPADTLPDQAGQVETQRQHVEASDSQRTDPASNNRGEYAAGASGENDQDFAAAAQAEATRVKAKFASIDTSTEVTLRFDFISDTATRVSKNGR